MNRLTHGPGCEKAPTIWANLSTTEGIPSQPALNFVGVLEIMREILKVEVGEKTLKKDLDDINNC